MSLPICHLNRACLAVEGGPEEPNSPINLIQCQSCFPFSQIPHTFFVTSLITYIPVLRMFVVVVCVCCRLCLPAQQLQGWL